MTKYLSIIIIFMLSGCSDNPYQKYIGLWERQNIENHEILEIKKDGETILLNHIVKNDEINEKNKSMVLAQSEGHLSVQGMFGNSQLGLSDSEDILRIANQSYKKIDNNRLNEIKTKIEQKNIERKKNSETCKSVKATYKIKKQQVADTYKDDWKMKSLKNKELSAEIKENMKSIPGCSWFS